MDRDIEKELPVLTIGEDRFLLDTANDVLRWEERPDRIIRFAHMEDKGTHYEFRYYPHVKSLEPADKDDPYLDVQIQPLVRIDPEGMSKRYGLSLEQMEGMTDNEVIVKEELIRKRMEGHLPNIDIAGHQFTIDASVAPALKPVDNPSAKGITMNELEDYYSPSSGMYQFPFDLNKRTLSSEDLSEQTEFPKHIVVVGIPTFTSMDPVGMSQDRTNNLRAYLRRYPPKETFTAERIPWEDTRIGDMILKNKQRQKQEETDKPNQRPRLRP